MRTQRISRYLTAMIIALGTSFNVFAQQRSLKIYFNEYANGETKPRMYVTDDHPNSEYDVPSGVTVSHEGVAWANNARFFEWVKQDVTDRLVADYVVKNGEPDKKNSRLKLSFTSFPYEVNTIQWNVMNDFLSGSLTNFFQNYNVTTTCVPVSGSGFSYTQENWALNIFSHQFSFNQGDIPWKSGATLKGLKSFEIKEKYEVKVGIGGWTWFDLGQSELSAENRTFIKAGWNGAEGSSSNISDNDDDNWAFKVKFTLPDIRLYFEDGRDGYILKPGEENVQLLGKIVDHAGAVIASNDPRDLDDFHYEFSESSNGQIIELAPIGSPLATYSSGNIISVKEYGSVDVTVHLMRGEREVCSYTQRIWVSDLTSDAPEIGIAFNEYNGKKGYDFSVGEKNAQIQGVITKDGIDNNGNTISSSTSISSSNTTGYHFEYYSDNTDIATINKTSGKITAKKEGDVNISAILMNGTTPISHTYSYTLHIFAKNEGLELKRVNTYRESDNRDGLFDNWSEWQATTSSSNAYDWKYKQLLNVDTTIDPSGANWKQITCFTATSTSYWRAICQQIQLGVKVPKYSKATSTYEFAGNVAIGTIRKHTSWGSTSDGSCKYGFEVKDLGVVTESQADTKTKNIYWNTSDIGTDVKSTPTNYATIVRNGTEEYKSNVGARGNLPNGSTWVSDNSTGASNITESRYLAVMAYLWKDEKYPGTASFGFKGIPTYTYYATVTYHMNDGTNNTTTETITSESKTEKKSLSQPTRTGYTFMGWASNADATSAEYTGKGDFCPYDDVNGGGKGPVNLYAVWSPNAYAVTLDHNGGPGENEHVIAYYGQPMPESEDLLPLTRKGYDFTGYSYHGTYYYDANMKSARNYDQTCDFTIYANWKAHTTKITFDPQGGDNYGVSEVTATYGQAMPKEGVQAPQRTGYEFGGYYSKQNGKGTQYYNYSKDEYNNWVITSASNWNIDQPEVTLYAYWIANKYLVTLNRQGGTGGTGPVTAYYGELLPSGKTAPTKAGYKFKGYYSNENQEYAESVGQNYGGTQYYDEDMNGVEPWDKTGNTTIYAHWAPATYVVTFDAGSATLPQGIIDGNKDLAIEQASDGIIKIRFTYGVSVNNIIDNSKPKKPAYNLLGFYDENDVLVATVSVDDPDDRHIHLTGAGNYWEQNGTNVKWVHTGDLTLTAKYERKFTVVDGNMIKFGSEAKVEYVEPKHDWLMQVVNDLIGAAQEVGSKENPVMVFDMTDSKNIWTGGGYNCQEVMESLQASEYSDIISPNVLVYFNEGSYNNKNYETNKFASNAITADNKCLNLYVTDRYQMKIPYAFNAAKALYERNKVQKENDDLSDAMWKQSHESVWGTLCLPYPITNNNTHKVSDDIDCKVIFYDLRKRSGNVMQFYKLAEDAVIPANTPVLYERTEGVSSAVTIEERSDINDENVATINVPANPKFTTVTKTYADAPEPSIQKWQFIGSLEEKTFCGKDCTNPPAGAIRESEDLIYYFKTDNFTRMGDKTWMKLIPYRAYFREVGGAKGGAKISSYSILVVDENGATDITDAILGEGEGDGKIYDLNGIRVMQPVKGRLYIVNGKKKVYE